MTLNKELKDSISWFTWNRVSDPIFNSFVRPFADSVSKPLWNSVVAVVQDRNFPSPQRMISNSICNFEYP